MTEQIFLNSPLLKLGVSPLFGGSITALRYKTNSEEVPLMRDAAEPLLKSSDASSFLMAPWVGRVKNSTFNFEGKKVSLPNPEKHSIHGLIRDLPFKIISQDENTLVLNLNSGDFKALDSYPFKFDITQEYKLSQNIFTHKTIIKNLSEFNQPVGAGYHPYFRAKISKTSGRAVLKTYLSGYFKTSDLPIPESIPENLDSRYDFSSKKEFFEGIDACFSGWNGSAELSWPNSNIRLLIKGGKEMKYLVLFTPPEKPFVAVEPMSTPPNALNLLEKGVPDLGIKILAPNESVNFEMQIEANS